MLEWKVLLTDGREFSSSSMPKILDVSPWQELKNICIHDNVGIVEIRADMAGKDVVGRGEKGYMIATHIVSDSLNGTKKSFTEEGLGTVSGEVVDVLWMRGEGEEFRIELLPLSHVRPHCILNPVSEEA